MQLVRFLMKMTSEYVQIELKDGTVVAGTVANVTPNMNTILRDVKMTTPGEDPLVMDTITLRGNAIRYFVLPDTLNLDAMISDDSRTPRSHVPARKRSRPDAAPSSVRGGRERLMRGGSRGGSRGAFRGGLRGGPTTRGGPGGAGRGMARQMTRGGFRGRGSRGSRGSRPEAS